MQLQGLAHVGLFVTDLKRSLAFYTDKLGFRVIWENSNPSPEGDVQVAFAQSGDFVMELAQFPHPQQRTDGWFDHIALRVKDLDTAMAQLAEKGVEFEEGSYTDAPQVFQNGSRWVLLRGPDNEHLELNECL